MQTSAPVTSETAKVRAALAERTSTFPLVTGAARTPRSLADQIAWRTGAIATSTDWLAQVDQRRAPKRFTGEPVTMFGDLL